MTQDQSNIRKSVIEALMLLAKLKQQGLRIEESMALLECLDEHERALPFIEQYDQGQLEVVKIEKEAEYVIRTKTANILIENLKKHLSGRGENVALFGAPNTGNIDTVISSLYQTAYGSELYPSIESKAANLLYLLIKDHCFVDGNKRIAAFLFVWFLDMNGMLYTAPDEPVVSYALLYKLAIFIAESAPKNKDLIVNLISHIIAFANEVPPESFWRDR